MAAIVGVDLGGTKCLAVAVVNGVVAAEHLVPTPSGASELIDTLTGLVDTVVDASGEPLAAVGIGVPGLVDREGVLRFAPNLRDASGMSVKAELVARFGVPVTADNDATCATWGEFVLGAAQGRSNVLMVTLGTGIGGGIVTGGRIHRGVNGFAGELGHMVVDPHGPPCLCGRRGCWERFASGSGLGLLARSAALAGKADHVVELAGGDPESVKGEHVSRALADGDAEAQAIVDEFAFWLALGLANLANAFDPEAFVIGGGLVTMGDTLFDPARVALQQQVIGRDAHPPVPILPATLGVRAGAIGAAFLAGDELPITSARVAAEDRY
ncbi:MAG: ROK family protein [Acidimicrobiales bacterium]